MVDDIVLNLEALKVILMVNQVDLSRQVHFAMNGQQAVDIVKRQPT